MLEWSRESSMCTFGIVFSAGSGESYNPTHVLSNCAKIAATIHEQKVIRLDEFRHVRSIYLELYTNRACPP